MSNNRIYTDAEREHIEELSSAYVLGALTEDEAGLREFESLVESGDPLLSRSLEQMLGASVTLAMAASQIEPPASIRASLLSSVSKLQQSPVKTPASSKDPVPSEEAIRLKRRTRYFIGTSIFSGLLLCVLLALNVSSTAKLDRSNDLMKSLLHQTDSLRQRVEPAIVERPVDSVAVAVPALTRDNSDLNRFFAMFGEPDARLVTMASAQLGTSRQHLFFSPKQRMVAVMRENLHPLEGNRSYVLWATVGRKAPIAIGTFRIDAKNNPPIFNFSTKLRSADSFAISIEQGSGSSERKGKVIFTGEVPKSGIN